MFAGTANPYDEIITKATDENLASEDWALNIDVCDKVSGDGQAGARNAVTALQKRLTHRNPNVQLYALELANTLAQNCEKSLIEELSSRNWTGALDRLVNDRATAAPVKKKALVYIKAWAKQFEETRDPNLGLMGELYDQLRGKNLYFDATEAPSERSEDTRRRQEEEELARVLELSKQDKGGRQQFQPSSAVPEVGSSSAQPAYPTANTTSRPLPQQTYVAPPPQPGPEVPDLNIATRVRALYTFTSAEVGELNFERGDVIKVLDRGFKEWWRGACNGKIGIFPVTYVEAMPEPTPRELQEEAQEEARVFASLGLVDQLLQTLKGIDPSRGDRLDDRPEIEEMYQASVGLQGQINALIKKYSDQKAELEHMNANFLRAMKQYEELRTPAYPIAGQPQYGYVPPQDAYAQQYPDYPQQAPSTQCPQQSQQPQYIQQPEQHYAQQPPQQQYASQVPPSQHPQGPQQAAQPLQSFPVPMASPPAGQQGDAPGQYYPQQHQSTPSNLHRVPTGAPDYPPQDPGRKSTGPGAAGMGAADPAEHAAAWEAYYRQQAEQSGQPYHPQQHDPAAAAPVYASSGYPAQQGQGQRVSSYGAPGPRQVDGVTSGMGRMSVHGQ